jgi:hypothetical protein
MTERTRHSDGDVKHENDQETPDSAASPSEQAKVREGEMEESGEENAA